MDLDWKNLEDDLYATWVADVRTFAAENATELFCSFAAVVDPPVGRVDLCANTPDSAEESIANAYPHEYRPKADERDEIKWNPGEWLYYNFNDSSAESWCRFKAFMDEAIESAADDENEQTRIGHRFFSLCHKVLIRTAKDGLYNCLPRTDDFKLFCYHFHCDVAYARQETEKALVEFGALGIKDMFHIEVENP